MSARLVVPALFTMGSDSLLPTGEIDSLGYLDDSALIIALPLLLPACIAMGATFPLMLAFCAGLGDRRHESVQLSLSRQRARRLARRR